MMVDRVRVGDVLALQRRQVDLELEELYTLVGVYSFGKGIFHRDPKPGSEFGDYRFFSVVPGDRPEQHSGVGRRDRLRHRT